MLNQAIEIIQYIFVYQMLFGAVVLWKNIRYRGLVYLLLISAVSMVFNLLEENAGTRHYYLVTPALLLAKGPFFYLFVFQLVYPNKPSREKYLWHMIPMFIALGLTSWPRLVIVLGSLSQLAYALMSIVLILNYRNASFANCSDAESLQINWVTKVLVGFLVLGFIDLIRLNIQAYIPLQLNLGGQMIDNLAFLLLFAFLIVKALNNPRLFNDLEDFETVSAQPQPNSGDKDDPISDDIYRQLETLILEKSLHRKPRLSLNDLAQETGLNLRDISRAFNQSGGLSFCDYINKLRIDDIKQALDTTTSPAPNILDLAFECGFNSKSSFNAVFKREIGQTPSQYIKHLRN